MFCPKCGKEIPNQATFCPKCGAAISGAAKSAASGTPSPAAQGRSATAVKEKPPKKKHGKKVLIAAVLIVAAVFLLPKLFGAPDESLPEEDVPAQDNTTGPAADQTAELLAVIDEAETNRKRTLDDWAAAEDKFREDTGGDENNDHAAAAEIFREEAQILSDFLAELEGLRGKADAVSGLEANLTGAGDEYFNMLHDSLTALIEIYTFMANYLEFYDESVSSRPLEADYAEPSDYTQALSTWLAQVREDYTAISYPSSVKSEWEQYGAILEYNANIAQKLELSVQHNDVLRMYSAAYLSNRYDSAESNQYEKLLSCLEAESDHALNQWQSVSHLTEEMHAYAEMPSEEKDTYEFQYIRTGEILLNYDVVDTIYPSLYNTYDAFAIIRTGCISGTRSIVVEVEIEGFTQQYRESFNLDSSYKAIYIKPPAMTGELDLTAAKPAQLKITVSEKDGTLIEAKTFDITLKSKYDFEWYSDEYGNATQDNILCFLTPEADAIAKLKRAAIDEISDMTGDTVQSFVGYQPIFSNNYVTTYIQVAGLMRALYEDMGVRYNMNPFSISGSNQHIQLPEDVIANQSGLCVETSLVIASALQSANMHAFLVFPPGHTQVAVEVWNSGEEVGEYFLIETTALDSSNSKEYFIKQGSALLDEGTAPTGIITYYSAADWADYLKNEVEYIVDCNDARLLGMTPFAH